MNPVPFSSPINIFAGQYVTLGIQLDIGGIQPLITGWRLSGGRTNYVDSYSPTPGQPETGEIKYLEASDRVNKPQVTFHPVADAPSDTYTAVVRARINGTVVTFTNFAIFSVHKPGQSIWQHAPQNQGWPYFRVTGTVSPPTIDGGLMQGAAVWQTSIPSSYPAYVGEIHWVQLAIADNWLADTALLHQSGFNTSGEWWLDHSFWYDINGYTHISEQNDGPDMPLRWWATRANMNVSFHDWLMWTAPQSGSVPVPIHDSHWSLLGYAKWLWTGWSMDNWAPGVERSFNGADTTVYPTWHHILINPTIPLVPQQ